MSTNLTLPLGLDGTVSVVFKNEDKVIVEAMNICAGNPTGFARKVCNHIKDCSCEIKYVPNTLSANFRFTITNRDWVKPVSGNPMSYLHLARMILDNCLRTTDGFSI